MKRYGVYDTDNFGGDYPAERWIVQPWLTWKAADRIAAVLNEEMGGDNALRYFKVGDQNYKLLPGFEP